MALKSSYVSILKAIKEAPHALQISALAGATGLNPEEVTDVTSELSQAGYLKFASDNSGFFTRTPKREEITNFLEGHVETLDGITFDAEVTEADYRRILSDIINAPEALIACDIFPTMNDELFDKAIKTLVDAKLIKEHTEKRAHCFTRKPMRDKILAFLAGNVTLQTLLDPEVKAIGGDTAQAPTTGEPTSSTEDLYLGIPEDCYRVVLSDITQSEHALDVQGWTVGDFNAGFIADILEEGGLIKEHRDQPMHYFTRKPMRRLIELFLESEISVAEMFERAAAREAGHEEPPTPDQFVTAPVEPCHKPSILEDLLFGAVNANLTSARYALEAAEAAANALATYRGR